jgi:hypothetical protein
MRELCECLKNELVDYQRSCSYQSTVFHRLSITVESTAELEPSAIAVTVASGARAP